MLGYAACHDYGPTTFDYQLRHVCSGRSDGHNHGAERCGRMLTAGRNSTMHSERYAIRLRSSVQEWTNFGTRMREG